MVFFSTKKRDRKTPVTKGPTPVIYFFQLGPIFRNFEKFLKIAPAAGNQVFSMSLRGTFPIWATMIRSHQRVPTVIARNLPCPPPRPQKIVALLIVEDSFQDGQQ